MVITLNVPLLYWFWFTEHCQTSPNKNKSQKQSIVFLAWSDFIYLCLLSFLFLKKMEHLDTSHPSTYLRSSIFMVFEHILPLLYLGVLRFSALLRYRPVVCASRHPQNKTLSPKEKNVWQSMAVFFPTSNSRVMNWSKLALTKFRQL